MSTPPTASLPAAPDTAQDAYGRALAEITRRHTAFTRALADAGQAADPRARTRAMTKLYLRARAMAASANDALGGGRPAPAAREANDAEVSR